MSAMTKILTVYYHRFLDLPVHSTVSFFVRIDVPVCCPFVDLDLEI